MKKLFISFIVLLCSITSFTQFDSTSVDREGALNVFIDCYYCDTDYIRNNIPYVNYVRDRKLAQVHILATTQSTGSGGTEYTFNMIGQQDFEGQNDTVSTVVRADATFDERREQRVKFLKIALIPYVAQTPMIDYINLDYFGESEDLDPEEAVDKWDYWVFRLGGNGWFNGEELYKSASLNGSFSANRITEKWKFENWASAGYNENRFKLDSVTTIINTNRNYFLESSAVRSINDHWSTGIVTSARESTFSNIKFNYNLRPALEYNVFDYADFTRKQIRIQYRVGFNHFQYNDTTIYNQIQENLFNHSLSVAAEFTQKWGSLNFSAVGSQYLHDPSLNKLTFWGSVSWRVVKGLSINFGGNIEFIRDQISLPKGGASEVEILTQQRLLATQYSYWGNFGFSYTFGSIYNNIVNPRFGN